VSGYLLALPRHLEGTYFTEKSKIVVATLILEGPLCRSFDSYFLFPFSHHPFAQFTLLTLHILILYDGNNMRKIISPYKLILLLFIGINQRKILKWINKTSLSFIQLFLPSAIDFKWATSLVFIVFIFFSNFKKEHL